VSRDSGQTRLPPIRDTRARFERGREREACEARTIARLNDVPDIVNVHDVFLANTRLHRDGIYSGGNPARTCASEGGRIPPETLLALLKPIFAAHTQIHRQNILPRDVSPDNIMFRAANGRPCYWISARRTTCA
jgi:serine/threonine protein kinase